MPNYLAGAEHSPDPERPTGMPAVQRNRLAVLTATLMLLVAGLFCVTMTAGSSSDRPLSTSASHLHAGLGTPAAQTFSSVAGHLQQVDDGALLAVLLLALTLGTLHRSRSRPDGLAPIPVRAGPSRGPPSRQF
jgi:hypothetical protein